VSLSVQLGLLLALATAFVSILGFLYKHRGAVSAPPVEWRHPVRSTAALFRNRWWVIGILVAMGGWVFHVAALALAPITLVQSVIAGGLVLLTVISERLFGLTVTRREWIGVALTAAGLAFLAATLGEAGSSEYGDYDTSTLVLFVGGLALASVPLMLGAGRSRRHAGTLLAAAAGLQWGASDVTIKAATGDLAELGLLVLLTPEAAAITALSFLGLAVSARSLQLGEAVGVIAVTSAAANLSTIASGLVVFGEPLPDSDLGVALRLLAFALVVLAAALTPGPVDLARRDRDAAAQAAA
jgi:multidrug transporter EmrE-like cation transporter